MAYHIRTLMMKADGFEKLQGHVEVDETYVGGRQSMKDRYAKGTNKTIVMGMKERGGRMVAESIPDVTAATLRKRVLRTVKPGSTVSTDELHSHNLLTGDGYIHGAVNHSIKEYARGEHHTNQVESFWRLFKNSIRSTHIHVSEKYMGFYLSEFTFRPNNCQMTNAMFDLLIAAA